MVLLMAALLFAQASSVSPSPAPSPSAPAGPVVVLETSLGRIRIALDQEKAPISTANFLKYARSGHYAGTVFHRVMPRFMIQGGGMTAEPRRSPPPRRPQRGGTACQPSGLPRHGPHQRPQRHRPVLRQP